MNDNATVTLLYLPAQAPPSTTCCGTTPRSPPTQATSTIWTSSNVLRAAEDAAWATELLTRASELARDGTTITARILQRRTAAHDPAIQTTLYAEIAAGSINALDGVDDLRLLPPDAAATATRLLSERVVKQLTEAQQGSYTVSRIDPLHTLALLNRWHPSIADWDEVRAAFTEPRMQSDQLVGVLRVLASRSDGSLAESDRVGLIEAIRPLLNRPPRHPFIDHEDIRGVALEALASLGDDVDLTAALSGGSELRRSAATIIRFRGDPGDVELILALANDHDSRVQAAAACALGRWATSTPHNTAAITAAITLIERSGTTIAQHLASAIELDAMPIEAAPLLELLTNHESAAVRRLATQRPSA